MSKHVVIVALTIVWAASSNADVPVGCDATRVATAHHAGGVVVEPQPAYAPIGCSTQFGDSVEFIPVGVAADGTVFAAPLVDPDLNVMTYGWNTFPMVARSSDYGATWTGVATPAGHQTGMGWMSVDPTTSRLWYTSTQAAAAKISWSDDHGDTWGDLPIPACCPNTQGAAKIVEGPAPADGAQPTGYDHVVYYCANMSAVEGPVHNCWKSLDGG